MEDLYKDEGKVRGVKKKKTRMKHTSNGVLEVGPEDKRSTERGVDSWVSWVILRRCGLDLKRRTIVSR